MPRRDTEVPKEAGMPMTSGLMLPIPEANLGLGIASVMLAGPLAQVPLLRSSQREPSVQDIIWAATGSAEKD